MEHTQGKWEIDQSDMSIEIYSSQVGTVARIYTDYINAEANARLIAAAPVMLRACKELADIFPEQSMSEMDAADFKDRAHRIWTAAETAKNIIAATQND